MKSLVLCFICCLAAFLTNAQTFTITSVSPAANAPAAPRTSPIRLTFSEPVSAVSGTVQVNSTQRGGRIVGTLTAAGTTLLFTPQQPFLPGETVSVTVTAAVQSTTGNFLRGAHVYQFTTAATGSGNFVGKTVVSKPTDFWHSDVTMADVDGDGNLDVLIRSNLYPGKVRIQLNNGSGIFTEGQTVILPDSPDKVLTADIDGDGDLDMIVDNGATVSVRYNDGRGTFSGGTDLSGIYAAEIAVADMTGDGSVDLLVTSFANMTATLPLLLFVNDGRGVFLRASSPIDPASKSPIVVGDLDQDGDLDVITQSTGQSLKASLNDGKGNFTLATLLEEPYVEYEALTLGDVDADGDLDLLTLRRPRSGTNTFTLLINDGKAGFRQRTILDNTSRYGYFADVNGDGALDVLCSASDTVGVLLNQGAGTFGRRKVVSTISNLQYVRSADLDGDGDLDLLLGESYTRTHIRFNQALSAPLRLLAWSPTYNQENVGRRSPVTVQFDQDLTSTSVSSAQLHVVSTRHGGRLAGTTTQQGNQLTFTPQADYLPGERVAVSVTAIDRTGNSQLALPKTYHFTTAVGGGVGQFSGGSSIRSTQFEIRVLPADVDGDGDQDILTYGMAFGEIQIGLNKGDGTYPTNRYFVVPPFISGISVNDIDGDGDLDILVSSGSMGYTGNTGVVTVCRNNGLGFFSQTQLAVGNSTRGIVTGDIDGDGDVDILTANGGASLGVNLNQGDGTFAPVTSSTVGFGTDVMLLEDMDADGDLDLVTVTGTGYIIIVPNDGNGKFLDRTRIDVPEARTLAVTDIDNDGDLDLVTNSVDYDPRTTATTPRLEVLVNDGTGKFPTSITSPLPATVNSLVLGDVDHDGDMDALLGSASGGNIYVYLGDGKGVFSKHYTLAAGVGTSVLGSVALTDVDGDQDLDIIASNFGSFGIVVKLNRIGPDITSFSPASGRPGTVVTVTGTNLDGVTAVALNGQPVDAFTPVNTTSFTFVVPAGATTGLISVTSPGGPASSSTPFVLLVYPPTISGMSPERAPAGSPILPVIIRGTNFIKGLTYVSFKGFGLLATVVSDTELTTSLPAETLTVPGVFPVSVINNAPGGGLASRDFTVTTTTSVYKANPAVHLDVYPNPAQKVCMVQLRGLAATHPSASLQIVNSVGQVVATAHLTRKGTAVETMVAVQHLAPGSYTLRVTHADGVLTRLLLVE